MGIASLVVSIVAALVSIVSIYFSVSHDNKNTSLSLQSRYFEKIFDEYLITEIPTAREYIRYMNNKLADADTLMDKLSQMRRKAIYFKYANPKFFNELSDAINELEDFLSDCSNRAEPDSDKQSHNILEIGNRITNIYKIINTYSIGKKAD